MTTRILIFGTYDGIHEGHRDFFKQARSLSDTPYLIVSLARDKNVTSIKGRPPVEDETKRLHALKQEHLVDEAVLGALEEDYIAHIAYLKPDIIALGYDQIGTSYTESLEEKLKAAGLSVPIVRCEPYKPDIYKSSKLKR